MTLRASRPPRLLFVCHYNRKRSATAERIFGKREDLDVRSAGTSADALVQVNARMLDWADVVFVMDDEQCRELPRMFPNHPALQRIVCLQIQDDYHFLDATLVSMLEERVAPHLQRVRSELGPAKS